MTGIAKNNQTHIKIGGWDQESLAEGETLRLLKTHDKLTWGVNLDYTSLGGDFLPEFPRSSIIIDPGFPFIHIFKTDFAMILPKINSLLNKIQSSPPPCEFNADSIGYCKINQPCSSVKK